MKPKLTQHFLIVLFALLPLGIFALEPKVAPGSVYLKNGEVLNGLVAPLGDHASSATVFQAERNSKKSLIPHAHIERVVQNGQEFVPAQIPVNGGSTEAYLERKASGPAELFRAHYYAQKSLGKNNTVKALHSGWVLSTPYSGLVNLGQHPDATELNRLLQHPLLEQPAAITELDDASLIKLIDDHNTAVRSALTGIAPEEHRNDR